MSVRGHPDIAFILMYIFLFDRLLFWTIIGFSGNPNKQIRYILNTTELYQPNDIMSINQLHNMGQSFG